MIARITARRAALAAQLETARQQYDQLEQALKELDRQLCALAGGLQELDALLEAHGEDAQQRAAEHQDGDDIADGDDQELSTHRDLLALP